MSKSIAERMEAAAEENLGLPYSLMCDAWKIHRDRYETTIGHPSENEFNDALEGALDAWHADPMGYQFNARAVEASEYNPADDAAAWATN